MGRALEYVLLPGTTSLCWISIKIKSSISQKNNGYENLLMQKKNTVQYKYNNITKLKKIIFIIMVI